MSYTYEYPRGALTVDCIVFGLDEEIFSTVQVERLKSLPILLNP